MEEIAKQVKIELDVQKCFTQMNKDCEMKNGIRSQVVKLDTPMKKQTLQEITNGNSKTTLNKRIMTLGRSPLNDR